MSTTFASKEAMRITFDVRKSKTIWRVAICCAYIARTTADQATVIEDASSPTRVLYYAIIR